MHHPHPQVLTPRACGGRVAHRGLLFYAAHRGLLTSASPRRKTCVFAPASQPDRNTHGPGVRPEKTRCWKGQTPSGTSAKRGKSFRPPFTKGGGALGRSPNSASAEAETPALAKSAGGDSASRSPRDRARCGGPTRREGSPGREDLTSFLRVRSGAALDAVLPAPGVERKTKILSPKADPQISAGKTVRWAG